MSVKRDKSLKNLQSALAQTLATVLFSSEHCGGKENMLSAKDFANAVQLNDCLMYACACLHSLWGSFFISSSGFGFILVPRGGAPQRLDWGQRSCQLTLCVAVCWATMDDVGPCAQSWRAKGLTRRLPPMVKMWNQCPTCSPKKGTSRFSFLMMRGTCSCYKLHRQERNAFFCLLKEWNASLS